MSLICHHSSGVNRTWISRDEQAYAYLCAIMEALQRVYPDREILMQYYCIRNKADTGNPEENAAATCTLVISGIIDQPRLFLYLKDDWFEESGRLLLDNPFRCAKDILDMLGVALTA